MADAFLVGVNGNYAEVDSCGNVAVGFSKGSVTKVINAVEVTTTSSEIDCQGFNAILVQTAITNSKNWTVKVQGSLTSGGTFVDWYELANTGSMAAMSHLHSAGQGFIFKGIPDYVKIVATEEVDGGACTVTVQPMNV